MMVSCNKIRKVNCTDVIPSSQDFTTVDAALPYFAAHLNQILTSLDVVYNFFHIEEGWVYCCKRDFLSLMSPQ